MNLIDTYIDEVGRRLPAKGREDIQKEIRSLLQDMLDDRSRTSGRPVDEEMIVAVLQEYGSPEKAAAAYQAPRYLIGPRLFPDFLNTLRIALPIVGVLALLAVGVSLGREATTLMVLLEKAIDGLGTVFKALVITLGYIILIFTILERTLPETKEKAAAWDAHSLAKISPPDRVSISGSIFEIISNMAAIIIFVFYSQWIGLSFFDGTWHQTPLLSQAFYRWLPALVAIWALEIGLHIWLVGRSRWTRAARWFSVLINLANVVVAAAMLVGPSLVAVTPQALANSPFDAATAVLLVDLLSQLVRVGLGIILVVNAWGMVETLMRLYAKKLPALSS